MFSPKYRVFITNECFPGDKVICLGEQLILIVSSIKNILPQHLWYGADMEFVGKADNNYEDIQLKEIGVDLDLVEFCSNVDQFIWGEFLCVDGKFSSQNFENIELETEDSSFRPIGCSGILLEIRTFDTAYFEIYTENFELIDKVSRLYKVEVEDSFSG